MKTNCSTPMRELTENEMTSVAGGEVLGAIPGVTDHVSLPDGLFVSGAVCGQAFSPTGEFIGGVCFNY
jgi:hypothetical protein